MGALALATEDPNPELLNEMPHGRNEALITKRMWKHILVQVWKEERGMSSVTILSILKSCLPVALTTL